MSFIERFDEILEEVSQHDASLIMEDIIINDSIDMFFVETADDSLVGSSKVTSPHYIVMRQKLKKLVKLHRELNTFTPKDILKYSGDDWMDRCREYSYMSPEEFQQVHGGTCWEYAQYQYIRLKDMGYNAIDFYIEIDDSEVNHTFTIVKERNKYIYLESYLDECRGIYVADHIADIFTLVTSKLSEYMKRRIGYKIHIYHGYDNYGCDYFVFKEHMKSQKVVAKGNISYMDKKVPNVQMLESVDEDCYLEGVVFNEKDIYYNRDKFEKGETNLCFITGHSGSGKSTMAKGLASTPNIEHYELDDVVANKMTFTMNQLKEYGDLIYSFFTGVGKKYYYDKSDVDSGNVTPINGLYEEKLINDFVDFSIKYANSHNDKKIIIEGIWLYEFIEPSKLKEYAVYVKGTSALLSTIRAANRDSRNDFPDKQDTFKRYTSWIKRFKVLICGGVGSSNNGIDIERKIKKYREYFMNICKDDEKFTESVDDDMLTFEAAIEHSFYLKEVVEKNIFETLDMPDKRKKFKRIQDEYINRNIDKLSTAGPQYLIVFGDTDQKAYYDLFGIRKEEIIAAMKKVTSSSGSGSEFKFLTQNPILVVLYFCIRYFTINKDQSSLNGSLSIYALAIYWSIFTKYFKHGVIGPVMEYTIDNLTEKFMIKKAGNIFNTLNMSIRQSYEFHKKRFFEGGDDDITAFAQRIRNDQNSLIKKIANEYMKNYKDGNAVVTRNDNYDSDKPILDDVDNASTIIQNQVSKVTLPIISDGVDLVLAEAAAKLAEISVSDCREYLIKILVQKNLERLEDLIEGLLFMFIYTDKRTVRDIKSQLFLVWGASLFKKTNSKDPNLAKVNRILEEWAIESGIYARYNRPGTRINYKKGILFYIILSIQKNS